MLNIDLHCHLDGSLPLQMVQTFLQRPVKLEDLQVSQDCQSLIEYLEKFEMPLQCLQTYAGLQTAACQFMESLQTDQLRYVEVRFAPMLSVNDYLSLKQVIEAVLSGLKKGQEKTGIFFNVILCLMRHHTQEQNEQVIKVAREFLGNGVCALDLAGAESVYPMSLFREMFLEASRQKIPFTIHAGECGSAENIAEAIQCGARRIGHGIAMRGKEDIQALCKEKRIGIEMCPISNWQTKAISSLEQYPLREFLNNGLLVTVNTDNRIVSNTSLKKEETFIRRNWQITDFEIQKLEEHAIEVAFASDEIKQELWRQQKTGQEE